MENNEERKIGLTSGPRLEVRSVRRGKITADETLVERVIKSAKFGEIRTSEIEEVFWVEYPNLVQPAGPFDSRYAAEQRIKILRAGDEENLGCAGAVRLYAVAQGIARRVKTCEREIADSAKLVPADIRERWIECLGVLMAGCESIHEQVPYAEIWDAYEQQEADKLKVS